MIFITNLLINIGLISLNEYNYLSSENKKVLDELIKSDFFNSSFQKQESDKRIATKE